MTLIKQETYIERRRILLLHVKACRTLRREVPELKEFMSMRLRVHQTAMQELRGATKVRVIA